MLNSDEEDTLLAESMLIQSDTESPNILKDNILYYIAGFIVNQLLTKLECVKSRSELLLDPDHQYADWRFSVPILCCLEDSEGNRSFVLKKSHFK